MATLNRIPVNVNHSTASSFAASNSEQQQREQEKFSSEFRTSSSSQRLNERVSSASDGFNMRNINDETERIRNRMRDFEEHCRRVREQAFSKTSFPTTTTTTTTTAPSFFNDSSFDQRVPLSSFDSNATTLGGSSSRLAPLGSSMHRSSIEDTGTGGKKYRLEFDIGDFNQNELYISTNGRTLVVKGDRELKAGSATETKTFNRELTLPDYVDINKMNAFLLDNAPQSLRSSHTQLVAQSNGVNNVLVVEAPIIMEKYTYRRSAYSNSQSPIRISAPVNSSSGSQQQQYVRRSEQQQYGAPLAATTSESQQRTENKTSSSTSTTTKIVKSSSGSNILASDDFAAPNTYIRHTFDASPTKTYFTTSQSNLNQSQAPELIPGYPAYDSSEGVVVYKFDLSGFDQSEIHLTITADRVLEIKACKETSDQLGKIYREFKREIHLEPDVDDKQIKNVLHDGLLTLKIPKANRPDGLGSLSNTHNLNAPNGFREIYTDEGKLAKLTGDFRGFNPENVKIVLSANNVLKVTAQQAEASPNAKGSSIQKECTRQYTLPAWVQPENMKAIMSRDGVLTVDFHTNNAKSGAGGDRININ